jgi:hypothetical protein
MCQIVIFFALLLCGIILRMHKRVPALLILSIRTSFYRPEIVSPENGNKESRVNTVVQIVTTLTKKSARRRYLLVGAKGISEHFTTGI